MTEVLTDHAPRVRCYACGADRIFSVCHHCQRPMCEEHSPLVLRQGGTLVRTPSGAADEARPVSKEFAGLRLGGLREAVYHCQDHDHMVHGGLMGWVVGGAGVAVLGLILSVVGVQAGLVLLPIGAIAAGIAFGVHRMMAARAGRPPLPLVAQVNTIDVIERLTGYVRLEKGEYTSTVESIAGAVTVETSANSGHTLLQAYRKKFRVPGSQPVAFAAGFLMLEGDTGLAFRAGQPSVLTGGTGISLGGDGADDHDLFPVDPELPQRESTLVVDYDVQDGRSPRDIPLWIVPSLVPSSDRRTLEIDLHWQRLGPQEQRLSLAVFELIELAVPTSWGNVESSAPGRVEIGRAAGRRTIRWKQVKPNRSGADSLTLTLRFERPITEIPEAGPAPADLAGLDDDESRTRLTLAGTVVARFNGLLSGVTGVGVYLPGGGPGHRPAVVTQTKVTLGFDVSLRSIRYQDRRVVPDENNQDDVAYGRNRSDEFPGVIPDFQIAADLTNAISADNYYVKSVVEHPPYRDHARPNVVNRVWDIAGRLYIGLFPIDFYINLRGDEARTVSGLLRKTVAQVTVKGAYALGTMVDQRHVNDVDDAGVGLGEPTLEVDGPGDELLERIEDTWTSLRARVGQILAGRADRSFGTRSIAGSSDDVLLGEVIDDDAMSGSATHAGSADAVADLRRRWKAADEAVTEGRMSEEIYRGIVARIQAELSELGERP